MSKVKLIICEGYGNQGAPRIGGSEKVIDLDLKVPDTHDIMGVIRTDFDKEPNGDKRVSDAIDPVIRYERINNLVRMLLTQVDAIAFDKEQREAVKKLFTQIAWDWYNSQSDELREPWRRDKRQFDTVK